MTFISIQIRYFVPINVVLIYTYDTAYYSDNRLKKGLHDIYRNDRATRFPYYIVAKPYELIIGLCQRLAS